MAERGVQVDHATLNRWIAKYSPLIAEEAHRRKSRASKRAEPIYIKVKGKWWCYYYHAVDKTDALSAKTAFQTGS